MGCVLTAGDSEAPLVLAEDLNWSLSIFFPWFGSPGRDPAGKACKQAASSHPEQLAAKGSSEKPRQGQ